MRLAFSLASGRTLAALRGQPRGTTHAVQAASPARSRAATGLFALVLIAAACICVAVLGMVLALFWMLWGVVNPVMLGVFTAFMVVALLFVVPLHPEE